MCPDVPVPLRLVFALRSLFFDNFLFVHFCYYIIVTCTAFIPASFLSRDILPLNILLLYCTNHLEPNPKACICNQTDIAYDSCQSERYLSITHEQTERAVLWQNYNFVLGREESDETVNLLAPIAPSVNEHEVAALQ